MGMCNVKNEEGSIMTVMGRRMMDARKSVRKWDMKTAARSCSWLRVSPLRQLENLIKLSTPDRLPSLTHTFISEPLSLPLQPYDTATISKAHHPSPKESPDLPHT